MPTLTLKQPNGKYALFTTISDEFTAWDCTRQDLITILTLRERRRIIEEVQDRCDQLDRGAPFGMTFEDALRTYKRVHRKDHRLSKRKWKWGRKRS
jgi:hypothetical protein